jgi:hypothetical protein
VSGVRPAAAGPTTHRLLGPVSGRSLPAPQACAAPTAHGSAPKRGAPRARRRARSPAPGAEGPGAVIRPQALLHLPAGRCPLARLPAVNPPMGGPGNARRHPDPPDPSPSRQRPGGPRERSGGARPPAVEVSRAARSASGRARLVCALSGGPTAALPRPHWAPGRDDWSGSGIPQVLEEPIPPLRPVMSRPPVFHTYAALAGLWDLSVKTLQNWVAADRKAGIETVTRYRVVGHRRREPLSTRTTRSRSSTATAPGTSWNPLSGERGPNEAFPELPRDFPLAPDLFSSDRAPPRGGRGGRRPKAAHQLPGEPNSTGKPGGP